eukprot:CAMPEP_0175920192 /NCGR_PEP_ID=MMETSP0108-20121206/12798_1 /TAXON_ID=195067 ORGANISM="Goniomonas pacifica, Strain CCMP1869" /NCGR_SAMPLE_ID=MMETSP0108 /ASSEMBLY_ACC=CAM_ASM_000204 /LENGTH=129 /DNA_ID=CAMNT_0017242893 /DNA_START=235 /DNA_END=621 /DNA_ORIENTATION=+
MSLSMFSFWFSASLSVSFITSAAVNCDSASCRRASSKSSRARRSLSNASTNFFSRRPASEEKRSCFAHLASLLAPCWVPKSSFTSSSNLQDAASSLEEPPPWHAQALPMCCLGEEGTVLKELQKGVGLP